MKYDQSQIRKYIGKSFDDQEIRTFCFDYFPGVYEDLTDGMRKSRKVELLLSHCMRRSLMPDLVAALARERPGPFVDDLLTQAPDKQTTFIALSGPITRNPRQVFISHAHQDAELAHWLAEKLNLHGWQSWIAPESIRPGEKWVEAINRGLAESGVFVLVLSETAVNSLWVRSETNFAIQNEHEGQLKFIPLKTSSHEMPVMPPLWQAYQQVPFDVDRKGGLEALLTELEPQKMAQLERAYATLNKAVQSANWQIAQSIGKQIEADYLDYRDVSQLMKRVAERDTYEKPQSMRQETLYIQLRSVLRAKEWGNALEIGEQILSVDQPYRDVEKWMKIARTELQNQKRSAHLASLYLQLQTAYSKEDWQDVQSIATQIKAIEPNYRNVDKALLVASKKLQAPSKTGATMVPPPIIKVTATNTHRLTRLSQQLQAAYDKEDWQNVERYANQIKAIDPNYRNVEQILLVAQKRLQAPPKARATRGSATKTGSTKRPPKGMRGTKVPLPVVRVGAKKTQTSPLTKNMLPVGMWMLAIVFVLLIIVWGFSLLDTGNISGNENRILSATQTADALSVTSSAIADISTQVALAYFQTSEARAAITPTATETSTIAPSVQHPITSDEDGDLSVAQPPVVIPTSAPKPTSSITNFSAELNFNTTKNSAGINEIDAQWKYDNIPYGSHYVRTWSVIGKGEWIRYECSWSGPESGTHSGRPLYEYFSGEGLYSGIWVLTIYVDNQELLKEEVVIPGNETYWDPVLTLQTNC